MNHNLEIIITVYVALLSSSEIETGLCELASLNIKSGEDYFKFKRIIYKEIREDTFLNRIFYDKRRLGKTSVYFWEKGKIQPRIEFLEYLIQKYSKVYFYGFE